MADPEGIRETSDINICALCGSFENLRLCARCGDCYYCSKDHQVIDWKSHKRSCRPKTAPSPPAKDGSLGESRSTYYQSGAGSSARNDSHTHQLTKHVGQMNICSPDPEAGKADLSSSKEQQGGVKGIVTSSGKKGDSLNAIAGSSASVGSPANDSPGTSGTEKDRDDLNKLTVNNYGVIDLPSKEGLLEQSSLNEDQSITKTDNMGGLNTGYTGNGEKVNNIGIAGHLVNNNNNFDPAFDKSIGEVSTGSSSKRPKVKGKRRMGNDSVLPEQVSSRTKPAETKLTDYVVKCLNDYGLCVVDNFMAENKAEQILDEVISLQNSNAFKEGQTVDKASIVKKVRGDQITWVEKGEEALPNIGELIERMDGLMVACNGRLGQYNINGRTKAMVACYPGDGTSYKRHVDNPKGDGRCVTCIYYLNKNWDIKTDGGLLRIYPTMFNQVADIEPKFDRLLFFWSDRRNPHEVQPTFRHRFAITVWYFDAEQRKRARIQYKISGMTEGSAYATSGQTFEVTSQ